jgi:hypothetical protein
MQRYAEESLQGFATRQQLIFLPVSSVKPRGVRRWIAPDRGENLRGPIK